MTGHCHTSRYNSSVCAWKWLWVRKNTRFRFETRHVSDHKTTRLARLLFHTKPGRGKNGISCAGQVATLHPFDQLCLASLLLLNTICRLLCSCEVLVLRIRTDCCSPCDSAALSPNLTAFLCCFSEDHRIHATERY